MNKFLFIFFILASFFGYSQQTRVFGTVWDAETGEKMPFVKVQFRDSKIGVLTDSIGYYSIETYYATDSLEFSFNGYISMHQAVIRDVNQEINVRLSTRIGEIGEITVKPPDEFPSTILHKRVVANKNINNKEKLLAYDYEVYNKIQLDLNNIGDKFTERGIVKRLDLVMDYLDSTESGTNYLPVILSESLSNFYFKNNPKKKKEVIEATRITGIENVQMNQFMGDMYLDINIYDNNINMFNKAFISPISDVARSFYKFYLEDSTFIDNQWCYKLRFAPKRTGDMTFEGEMWIHDTTYAVKQISASISPWANINYVQDLYFEHQFNQVAKEVWMLTQEKMIVDVKITKNTGIYGFYGRKFSSRTNFVINEQHSPTFYKSDNTVEFADSAKIRTEKYWESHRHEALSKQEVGINNMVDSLNEMPFFKMLKNLTYFGSTGYYPFGKIEVGSAFSLISYNPVEHFRTALALRTSNNFSRRIEFGGKIAYGFNDEKFKYGLSIRYNITPKKRGMLTTYYNYDIQQIGVSPTAASMGSTFGTLFRTGPLDKLTFVKKAGISLEKDVKKDFVLFGAFEWKEYTALGKANYVSFNPLTLINDTITTITTSEFTTRIRWTKDEEFLSGAFDRTTLRSKYPIFSLQGIFGVKGLFGGDYNYQKIEFQMEHSRQIGILGRIRYGANAGYVFGTAAYPFLKVHEGNQSYWLLTSTFNMLNFFEFISDKYVGGFIENHWEGLFFDRIPLIKKLKLRLVTTGRITYGAISAKNMAEMDLPIDTKLFGSIPYAEAAIGIENIFKVGRVDLVWRITHLDPGMSPLGIRARWAINF
ncbi:MAG: hypothetical protein RI883_39 [Bacteroidota bacterium]|jgi:hypothetical protein